MKEQTPLHVQMLGDFAIHYDGETVLSGYSRNNKAIYLLQYLLTHRGRGINRDTLMEVLYGHEETENPANALKLIVHRLRRLLLSFGLPDQEYVFFKNGKYGWNIDIPCEVDTELFQKILKEADQKSMSPEQRIDHYKKAISLYGGDFLPSLSTEDWVAPLAVHYQDQCISCIRKACRLLEESDDPATMLQITGHAASIFPYNEEIQLLKIQSLHRTKRYKEALATYEATVEMLYNEFGVSPSEELLSVYREMTTDLQEISASVNDIKEAIKEDTNENGAYYCNFQNFADTYRLIVRSMERSGMSAFLALCTVDPPDGIHALRNAIKDSLRRGDFFSRYSTKQYLMLLMGINQENCDIVFRRIEDRFRSEFRGKGVKIAFKAVSATDIDFFKNGK
jgi:DNA-binding SARP family transcriptional activator